MSSTKSRLSSVGRWTPLGSRPKEKEEVLAAFAAHKGEVTEGSLAAAGG